VKFGAIDVSKLDLPKDIPIHPDVAEYLATCVPGDYLPIYVGDLRRVWRDGKLSDEEGWVGYELHPPDVFIHSNWKGSEIFAHGFLSIGNDNGNDLAFDIRHGTLFRFEHDILFEEGRDVMDSPQRTESPPDTDGIRKFAPIRYESFRHFCAQAAAMNRTDRQRKK